MQFNNQHVLVYMHCQMIESQGTSPESDVPQTVAGLKPHRWSRKVVNAAHIEIMHWEPDGAAPAPVQASSLSAKAVRKPQGTTRTLRSRGSDNPNSNSLDSSDVVMQPSVGSDDTLKKILALIMTK